MHSKWQNYWICLYRGQDQLIEAESWIQTRLNRRDRSPGSLTVICTIKGWLNVWSNCNVCHARVPGAQTKVIQHLLQIEVNCNEVYLEHTLLAISVLLCAQGWCNTSRGYIMHESKANELNTLKHAKQVFCCNLVTFQPIRCVGYRWSCWLDYFELQVKLERTSSEVGSNFKQFELNFEWSWTHIAKELKVLCTESEQ